MCFVPIREQKVITCQQIISLLTFINELECVYCAVGNESLNSIQARLTLYRAYLMLRKFQFVLRKVT
jgi:hypothetical protein